MTPEERAEKRYPFHPGAGPTVIAMLQIMRQAHIAAVKEEIEPLEDQVRRLKALGRVLTQMLPE